MKTNRIIAQIGKFGFPLSLVLLLMGCSTPAEIKTASRAQIELIAALDDATLALRDGLIQFHQDQGVRIRDEGRVLIARQAINIAAADTNATATADGVFKTSNEKVRPWVDNAFTGPQIDAALATTQARLNKVTDPFLQGSLQNDLDDLHLIQAILSKKPKDIQQLEAIIQDDLGLENQTSERVTKILQILRGQIGLIKTSATTIDNWLTIDITLSKEQANSLEKAFSDAKTALDKGAK